MFNALWTNLHWDEIVTKLNQLENCFRNAFGLQDDADFQGLEYRGIEAWDSLGHMQLITILEDEFDIMLDTDDIIDMSSFKECVRLLAKYGVEVT